MNKKHYLLEILKRQIVEELVKDTIQEEVSIQKFKDSVNEETREALNENQEHLS